MKIKNIECKIVVDGQDATEHGEESSDRDCKSVWIISESGKSFEFHMDVSNEADLGNTFIYEVYADSILLVSVVAKARRTPIIANHTWSKVPDRPNVIEERPFTFANIEFVDEDAPDFEMREDVLKNVGQLEVLIWKSKTVSIAPKRRVNPNTHTAPSSPQPDTAKPIPEKKLKGRLLSATHRTALGDATFRTKQSPSQPKVGAGITKTTRIHPYFAKFVFNYASKSALQAQDILPYTPEADNDGDDEVVFVKEQQLEEENRPELDEMTMDQLREELRRRRVQEDEEDEDDDEDRRHKIKKEKLKREVNKAAVDNGKGKQTATFYDITGDD